jgi:hypothetical protein
MWLWMDFDGKVKWEQMLDFSKGRREWMRLHLLGGTGQWRAKWPLPTQFKQRVGSRQRVTW